MLQWINNAAIDRQKWDACVDKCEWGNIYALSWFLDIITNNQWEALVYGDYEHIMPVPFRKKFGIKYNYRVNFCQQLGVFASENQLPQSILNSFISELSSKYRHLNYPLNHANVVDNGLKKRTNLILNLNIPYTEIYQNYDAGLKKNLRKAARAELSFGKDIEPEKVISIYKAAWQSINNTSEEDYSAFKKIVEYGRQKEISSSMAIYKDNNELAACFLLKYKNRVYFPFSGITNEGRKYVATAFLIDTIIKEYSNSDCIFDFEGSDIESVRKFYEKFNPEIEYYFEINKTIPGIGKIYSLLKKT